MLAFMDLLKYQMTSKATMEQLFFITCDDRISKLQKYKLSGRGIELCELLWEAIINMFEHDLQRQEGKCLSGLEIMKFWFAPCAG